MRTFFVIIFVLITSFGTSLLANAQNGPTTPVNNPPTTPVNIGPTNPTGQDVKLINPLKGGGNLQDFLQSILDFVIKIGTVVVIFMMVFVGYKFVVAQGKEAEIREARDALLWTLIGALILLGSKAIAFGIEKTVQAISVGG